MTRVRLRGHALILVMTILFALGVGGGLVFQHLQSEISSRKHEEARAQLRWLARSALLRGERGNFRIELPQGVAQVRVHIAEGGTVAEASLPGLGLAWARRLDVGIEERFERATSGNAP